MYEFFRWIGLLSGWPLQLIFFKRKTYYEDKKEQGRFVKGGALIVSNHYSVFDYVVNMFLFPFRKLYVVMSEVNFRRHKSFKFFAKFFGGICADRDTKSTRFIDESVKLLEKGKLVQIYPEAHITTDGKIHAFKPSYIMIALRSGKPIIPVIIDGNYGIFKRAHVLIGKKIDLSEYCSSPEPTKQDILALNEIIQKKSQELKEELDRRVQQDKIGFRKRRKEI